MGQKLIQVITVIPKEIAERLREEKRVEGLDTIPHIASEVKRVVQEFIRDNVGYDKTPIAALSKLDGMPGELEKVGLKAKYVIPTLPGTTLWQLSMPEDMVVSVSYKDLLFFSNEFKKVGDEEEKQILSDEFKERLSVGYLDDDDVMSFIPFIDLNRCSLMAFIDRSWGIGEFSVPGVKEIKLVNLDMFNA